jgi:hypothetical protein
VRAGELLLEARSQIESRNVWFVWLKRYFKNADGKPLSERTARIYMQIANSFGESLAARRAIYAFPTQSSFLAPHRESHHQPVWHEPVRESINLSTFTLLIQNLFLYIDQYIFYIFSDNKLWPAV